MNKKKVLCCLAMIICLCSAIEEAAIALSHGIENNDVDDDYLAKFAESLDPFAKALKDLSSKITGAVGELASHILPEK